MRALIAESVAYARSGRPVFPCGADKKPLTEHGFKDATTEQSTVTDWWTRWPRAMIATPVLAGEIVVDFDRDDLFHAYDFALAATCVAKTPRGYHAWFKLPAGVEIKPGVNVLGEGIDVRTLGSYVILPPSQNGQGQYEWVLRGKELGELSAEVVARLREKPPAQSTSDGFPKIPKGQRHTHLLRLAGKFHAAGYSDATIIKILLAVNENHCDPPKSEEEVRRLAKDVCTRYPAGMSAKPGAQRSGEIVSLAKMRAFSSINPEPLRWLWPGRIPLGKLTIIAGDPGLGKSLLTIDIAARVSTGTAFPDGAACEQGSVILLSAEDDESDTIRPRLDAAAADVSRVHELEAVRNVTADGRAIETTFNLERDIAALEDAIGQTGARLIVIDPISAYLGGTDSHNNSAVRGLLSPLAALAGKYSVAIVAVTHLRKSPGAAIHRILESLAFSAAARAAWGVAPDPDDQSRQLFAQIKQNLGRAGALAYRIEVQHDIARIVWEPDSVAVDVNSVMGGFESSEDRSERREAKEWLRDFLADGPRTRKEVEVKSKSVGLKWMTVRRASDDIGIVKRKIGGRGAGWEWALPGE